MCSFPVLFDEQQDVSQAYLVRALPTTVLIDRQGTLVGRAVGPREWDTPQTVRSAAGHDAMNRMKKPFVSLAALLAATYLVLAVFRSPVRSSILAQTPGHHHGGTVSHSSFCAWACQARSYVGCRAFRLSDAPVFGGRAMRRK